MANRNIRDIVVKVSGKDIATAAAQSEKLNTNLSKVIETVKGTGRNFKSINTALDKLSSSMKIINSSMSASKIKTKGLETYQKRMQEVNKTLTSVNSTAAKTAANLAEINKSTSGMKASSEVTELAEGFKQLEKRINIAIVQLREIVENTGKTANRMKETREVTRQTGETFKEYSARVEKAKKSQDSFNNSARGLSGEGRSQKRAFGELAFTMNPLTSLYASIAINVYALSEGFRVLNEAANFDRLLSQTASFSAAVSGINVRGLARDMSNLSGGILSVRESMEFAIKGAAFNFTTEQLESLTVGARKASIALGRDFTDSMDRVLRGISKQEIELFDELGVVTRLTPAFTAYAISIGKTVDELSDYERQLALTIEVDTQLQKKFAGIENSVTAWETLGVTVKNTVDTMLIGISRAADPIATYLSNMLKLNTESAALQNTTADLVESQKIFADAMEDDYLGNALVAYSEIMSASEELASSTEDLSGITEEAQERVGKLTFALQALTVASAAYVGYQVSKVLPTWSAFKVAALAAASATRKVMFSMVALGNMGMAGIIAGITGSIKAMAVGVRALTVAMLTNPIFLAATVIGGGLLYAFRDELAELSETIIGLIPGMDNSTQALTRQEEAAKAAKEQYRALTKELKDIGVNLEGMDSKQVAEMGAAIKANDTTLEEASAGIQKFSTEANRAKGPFVDLIAEVNRLANTTKSIEDTPQVLEKNAAKFKEIAKEIGLIDSSIDTFEKLKTSIEKTNRMARDLAFNLSYVANNNTLFAADPLDRVNSELSMQKDLLRELEKKTILNKEAIRLKKEEILLLEQQKQIEIDREKLTKARFSASLMQFNFEKKTLGIFTTKADSLENEVKKQEKINIAAQLSTTISVEQKALEDEKLKSLQQQLVYQTKLAQLAENTRKADLVSFITNSENAQEASFQQLGGRRVNQVDAASRNTTSAEKAQALAQARYDEGQAKNISDEEKLKLGQELDNATNDTEIARIKEQAAGYRELQGSIEAVAGSVPGLTGIQEQFIGMSSTIADTIANTTELIASGQELTLADFSDSIIAVGSMASSMFSELSKGVIADIDNQIAAEKKRDGKSQESLAKIQALEKKKIKEQEKSKIAQTAMSTSLAIMKTMAEVPFPASLAMSAAIGAMGMMQINNIKKASAGQMAALQTDTGGLSLSVGSRNNAVDVGQGASRGELSFLRGESGIGTGANNFTPGRSGGGSVVVGERGPETITPTQPINVTPTSESTREDKPSVNQTLNLSIQAIDSQSIEDRSDDIWMALERAANERGFTLNSLS